MPIAQACDLAAVESVGVFEKQDALFERFLESDLPIFQHRQAMMRPQARRWRWISPADAAASVGSSANIVAHMPLSI